MLSAHCPIGKFGQDFNNDIELMEFWNSEDIENLYRSFRSYPMDKCKSCADYLKCAGGCGLNRFLISETIFHQSKVR